MIIVRQRTHEEFMPIVSQCARRRSTRDQFVHTQGLSTVVQRPRRWYSAKTRNIKCNRLQQWCLYNYLSCRTRVAVFLAASQQHSDVVQHEDQKQKCNSSSDLSLSLSLSLYIWNEKNNCWWGWQNRTALEKHKEQSNTSAFDSLHQVKKVLVFNCSLCVIV